MMIFSTLISWVHMYDDYLSLFFIYQSHCVVEKGRIDTEINNQINTVGRTVCAILSSVEERWDILYLLKSNAHFFCQITL